MKLFKKLCKRHNNKGFSLTELICAIAVLAVLGTAISGVMMVSVNTFRNGNNEVNVQEEIQLVCNQISDFLIDSTAEVTFSGGTLTIRQGSNVYKIYRKADNKIYFVEETSGEAEQVMAENVTDFNVDVSDFSENGNVKVSMEVEKAGRVSTSNYTVTARNKEVKISNTNTAAISVPRELVLIPGESYNIPTSVSGLTNQSMTWELVNNSSTATTITNTGRVFIDKAETSTLIKAHGVTVESVNGSPAAECWINIFVRRANLITVTGEKQDNGVAAGKAGAVYIVTGDVQGIGVDDDGSSIPNAGLAPDSDVLAVGFAYSHSPGVSSSDYTVTVVDSKTVKVRLNRNLGSSDKITIHGQAKHAYAANRASSDYNPTLEGTFDITGVRQTLWDVPGEDGWQRQSDQHQATLIRDALTYYINQSGAADNSWKYFMRFIPVVKSGEDYIDEPGKSWSTWIPAGAGNGGDANGSMTLNLRPGLTSIFEYNKVYKIEIIVRLYDNAGNEKWPLDNPDDVEVATYSSLMMPVTVKFDCNLSGYTFEQKDCNTFDDRFMLRKQNNIELIKLSRYKNLPSGDPRNGQAVVTGIPGDRIMNALNYKVEKLEGGVWQQYNMQLQQGDTVRMNNMQNYPNGIYRLKVWARDMVYRRLDSNGVTIGGEQRGDWDLFDQSVSNTSNDTGYGIFYFELY